jgi:hypothetical protein
MCVSSEHWYFNIMVYCEPWIGCYLKFACVTFVVCAWYESIRHIWLSIPFIYFVLILSNLFLMAMYFIPDRGEPWWICYPLSWRNTRECNELSGAVGASWRPSSWRRFLKVQPSGKWMWEGQGFRQGPPPGLSFLKVTFRNKCRSWQAVADGGFLTAVAHSWRK